MNITYDKLGGKKVIFETILDEITGGVSLTTAGLPVDGVRKYVPAGTPVSVNVATRVATVCKSAAALSGSTAKKINVPKLHFFNVGDLLNDGTTSAAITSITSGDNADVLNVGADLISTEGTVYVEGSESGTSTALENSPNAITKNSVYIADGNADVAVVTMGTIRKDALAFPISTAYETSLKKADTAGGISLINLV